MMPNTLSTKAQEPQELDINDVFEDILFSEEKVIEEGYQQGFTRGASELTIEGYHLGYHRGAEIGSEIGYYEAFVQYHLNKPETPNIPEKVLRSLHNLKQGCNEFPHTNSESVDLFETIERIRGLYKKICTQLKIKIDYKKEAIQF